MSPNQRSPFGNRLRQFRQEAALSQEDLAERAGLSLRGVSDLERGARITPRLETVRMLADGLGLTDAQRSELIAARSLSESASIRRLPEDALNLPVTPTSFIGRVQDIEIILRALEKSDTRMLTLTGPGGVGKTRLAIEIARRVHDDYSGGVVYVDLAPVRDSGKVLSTIATRLGVLDQHVGDPREALQLALENRELLLVLDNLEQVVGCAGDISWLIDSCPDMTILTTSRIVLRVSAERVLEIEPLSNPEIKNPGDIELSDAVSLFVARAIAADGRFALSVENLPAVVTIVTQLQGMPLAIELAAARIRLWPVDVLAQKLETQLPVLTGGVKDTPDRHRAMRDTVAWSYELLSPPEQAVMRAMSLFPVGCTLETVRDLFDHDDLPHDIDIVQAISTLVDSSLVRAIEGSDGAVRYRMLIVVQEFSLEQLTTLSERDAVRQAAHDNWCVPLASVAEFVLYRPDIKFWLNRISEEYENVRSHIDWLVEQDFAEQALLIVAAFEPNVGLRQRFGYTTELLRQLLAHPDNQGETAARMKGLIYYGKALSRERLLDLESTLEMFASAEKIARAFNDDYYLILALKGSGDGYSLIGGLKDAESNYHSAISFAESVGATYHVADCYMSLAMIANYRGKHAVCRELSEQALSLLQSIDNYLGIAYGKFQLSFILQQLGELDRAETLLLEAQSVFDDLGILGRAPDVLIFLGTIELQRNNLQGAKELFVQALDIANEIGAPVQDREGNTYLAWVAIKEGDYQLAKSILFADVKIFVGDAEVDVFAAVEKMDKIADLYTGLGDLPRAAWCIGIQDSMYSSFGVDRLELPVGEHQQRLDKIASLMDEVDWLTNYNRGFNLSEDEILEELRAWISEMDSTETQTAPVA